MSWLGVADALKTRAHAVKILAPSSLSQRSPQNGCSPWYGESRTAVTAPVLMS